MKYDRAFFLNDVTWNRNSIENKKEKRAKKEIQVPFGTVPFLFILIDKEHHALWKIIM